MSPKASRCADRVVETHLSAHQQHSPRPAPFIPRALSSGKKGLSTTIKASPSSPRTHKVAPSRQGSYYKRGLGGAAQREGARSGTGVQWAPHSRSARALTHGAHPTPSPTQCPKAPTQSEAAHAALPEGRHPNSWPVPRDRDLPSVSLLDHTHCPGAASPPGLHSASHSGSVPAPQDSAPGLWQKQPASREGVCARAACVYTGAGALRSPARPLLPPALHATMPVESLTRAPSRPGAHTRARAHPAAAPKGLEPRHSGSPKGGPWPPQNESSSPSRLTPLRSPAAPRGTLWHPSFCTMPRQGVQSGRRCSHPNAPASSY